MHNGSRPLGHQARQLVGSLDWPNWSHKPISSWYHVIYMAEDMSKRVKHLDAVSNRMQQTVCFAGIVIPATAFTAWNPFLLFGLLLMVANVAIYSFCCKESCNICCSQFVRSKYYLLFYNKSCHYDNAFLLYLHFDSLKLIIYNNYVLHQIINY